MITSIMIDNREPNHIQRADYGCPSVVTVLDSGDVWASCGDSKLLVVERKTPTDLLHSIADNRLFHQCARMKDVSPWCYVVITGQIGVNGSGYAMADGEQTQWRYDAVQGALLSMQEIGVGVLYARGDADFPAAIQRLGKRNRETLRVHPQRGTEFWSHGEAALLALPGIGEDRIAAVLKHTGTPAWALSWLTVMSENGVPGIGPGVKKAIRQALKLKENEEIHVLVKEGE